LTRQLGVARDVRRLLADPHRAQPAKVGAAIDNACRARGLQRRQPDRYLWQFVDAGRY
jgi:3-methyladenine DNA glycosylase Tag